MTDAFRYDNSTRRITGIDIDILGNAEINEMSVTKDTGGINLTDLYDNLEPRIGGLIDPRLGPSGTSGICSTCGFKSDHCPSHSGHIDLAEYVYHIGYIDDVKKILEVICLSCSKPLISKNDKAIQDMLKSSTDEARLDRLRELTKNISHCSKKNFGCGAPKTKIRKEIKKGIAAINIISEIDIDTKDEAGFDGGKQKARIILSPENIYDILSNISHEDCEILGMKPDRSEPKDMIHKTFHVPPTAVRPSVKAEFMGGSTKEDDLTLRLADIVKTNNNVRKKKDSMNETNNKYIKDYIHLLQYHVTNFLNNEVLTLNKNDAKSRQYLPLIARLKGKEGRMRKNLMGKRGDFTGRTVVTCYPSIRIDQLGIPMHMAKILTFPEIVTHENREKMQDLVRRGPHNYPGANVVFQKSTIGNERLKFPIDLRYKTDIELKLGDVVERHLVDGDIVLFNRQPSLHKQSMMAHKIVVINNKDYLTNRLSAGATTPYNADFDGDEMNIFVPQQEVTRIELDMIANINRQFISPSNSRTSMGIIQDGLFGAYNMTHPNMKIEWRSAMNIVASTTFDGFSFFKKKNVEYDGKKLFSLIIPKKINVEKKGVVIVDGEVKQGRVGKPLLAAGQENCLIQLVWNEYGIKPTADFISNIQWMMDRFNLHNGFTVGIGDVMVSKNLQKQVVNYIESVKTKVYALITTKENKPEYMDEEMYEGEITAQLNLVREEVADMITKATPDTNNFKNQVMSGAKGKIVNIGQMAGCVGLQLIESQSVQKKYNRRTSAYSHQDDDGPLSRGLIEKGYVDGMTFMEFVYSTAAGRAGSINGSVKTAHTGYAQRKLIKMMEDLKINYDGTVRTAKGSVIQFVYGDTGCDSAKLHSYKMKMIKMSNDELRDIYTFSQSELNKVSGFTKYDNDKLFHEIRTMRNKMRKSAQNTGVSYGLLADKFMTGVNFKRHLDNCISIAKKTSPKVINDPKYILRKLEGILNNDIMILVPMSKTDRENAESFKYIDDRIAKTLIKSALYDTFAPRRVIYEYKLSKDLFDKVINDLVVEYNTSIVEPGEMVGPISGQSMGEPLTQMNLDSIHSTGQGSLSYTLTGIARISELLAISREPKTPLMTIYMKKQHRKNKEMANKIASHLKYTRFSDVRTDLAIYFDKEPNKKGGWIEKDDIGPPFYKKNLTRNSCQSDINNLPWLVRIELSKDKMIEKGVTLLEIKAKFCSWWEQRYNDSQKMKKEEKRIINKISAMAIMSSSENSKNLVIHIRLNVKDADKEKFNIGTLNGFVDVVIDNFNLKGISGVENIHEISHANNISFGKRLEVCDKYDENDNEEIVKDKEYMIVTNGVNLIDIRYIHGIDLNRTITNNIVKVYETFGIEIARAVLLYELVEAYERGGSSVDHHPASLMVDNMTSNGLLMSMDRNGINKSDKGPLAKASFEKTVHHLMKAATFGKSDDISEVSSRIIVGRCFNGGTGYPSLRMNTKMILESEFTEDELKPDDRGIESGTIESDIINNDLGSKDIFIPGM